MNPPRRLVSAGAIGVLLVLVGCGGPTLDEVEALPIDGAAPQVTFESDPIRQFSDMESIKAAWAYDGSPEGYQVQYADVYEQGWRDKRRDDDALLHERDQWSDRLYIDNPFQGAEACVRVRAVHEDRVSEWSEVAIVNSRGSGSQALAVTCREDGNAGKSVGELTVDLAQDFEINWFYYATCSRAVEGECEGARSPMGWLYEYPDEEAAKEKIDYFLGATRGNMDEVVTVCNYLVGWDSTHSEVSFDERQEFEAAVKSRVC